METKKMLENAPAISIPYKKIVLCLLCICTICAGLLGGTFLLTKGPIAENEAQTINSLLVSIYGSDATFESVAIPEGQNTGGQKVNAIYCAKHADGSRIGYAIRVLSPGFSDDIDMIVGFENDGSVRKVEIISLSETAGLGSLVSEESYLAQYTGKSGTLALKTDVDAISGATKSSRAVLNGVNTAAECLTALVSA